MADFISPVTSRRRTGLIVTSLVTALLSYGFVSIDPSEPFELAGAKFKMEVDVMYWLLLVVIVYQSYNFGLAILSDLAISRSNIGPTLQSIAKNLESIEDRLNRLGKMLQTQVGVAALAKVDLREEKFKIIEDLVLSTEGMVRQTRRINRFDISSMKVRLYFWEIGVPSATALIALWGIYKALGG